MVMKMTKKAVVISIGNKWINLVSFDEEERAHQEREKNSSHCCSSGGCGCTVSGRPFKAALSDNIIVNPGDTVEVQTSTKEAIKGSIWILGIPILGVILAWNFVRMAFPGASEGFTVLGSLAGLLLAAGIVWIFRRNHKDAKKLPVIISVVS